MRRRTASGVSCSSPAHTRISLSPNSNPFGGAQMQPSGEEGRRLARARGMTSLARERRPLAPPTPGGTREGGVEPDRRISWAAGGGIVRRYEGELGVRRGAGGGEEPVTGGPLIPTSPHGQHRSGNPTRTQSIYLADMCGATARNGELCYGPNLGYGRFGAKVTMDCKLGGAQMQPSGE